ncbi:hypothetical protein [Oscillibacter sp. GMB15532]|uniref:hypothetical protein n=1 Tax=Oscillibacter sp. GMB15532 TaxID=3230022 RepID=UPI0034E03866
MLVAPFGIQRLIHRALALVLFNDCSNFPQNLLRQITDRRAQRRDRRNGIKVENGLKVLVLKIGVGIQSAAGHQAVGYADGGGCPERYAEIIFVEVLQKAALGAVADFAVVILIILPDELGGNVVKGIIQIALHAVVILGKRRHDRCFMLRAHFPKIGSAGVFMGRFGIGNVEHIFQAGAFTAVVNEGDASGAAPHPAVHRVIPELNGRAGRGFRPLGINHELFCKRIFVQAGGGVQKAGPFGALPCNLLGLPLRHLCIELKFGRQNESHLLVKIIGYCKVESIERFLAHAL